MAVVYPGVCVCSDWLTRSSVRWAPTLIGPHTSTQVLKGKLVLNLFGGQTVKDSCSHLSRSCRNETYPVAALTHTITRFSPSPYSGKCSTFCELIKASRGGSPFTHALFYCEATENETAKSFQFLFNWVMTGMVLVLFLLLCNGCSATKLRNKVRWCT